MGFGHSPGYADTVTDEFVKEQCSIEYKNFMECVVELSDIDAVAYALDELSGVDSIDSIDEEEEKKIKELLDALMKAFKGKTDLDLGIRFQEYRGKHDEVDGFFWEVTGVYQLTPAGEKFKDEITEKGWVVSDF